MVATAVIEDWPEWRTQDAWQSAVARTLAEETVPPPTSQIMAGECGLCDSSKGFRYTPGDLREGLTCIECRCNARQRAAGMVLLDELATPTVSVYITEQASPLFVALRRRLPRLRGSEFTSDLGQRLRLSLWLARNGVPDWIHRQDVTALSFPDAALDALISLDVLEHVPHFEKAIREFARVLRPGAPLVLTVPFYDDRFENETIAHVREDGSIEHAGEPEFHGDPLSGGVLCFHHFAWELLATMRAAGFSDAAACRAQDPARGLPQGVWVLHAQR